MSTGSLYNSNNNKKGKKRSVRFDDGLPAGDGDDTGDGDANVHRGDVNTNDAADFSSRMRPKSKRQQKSNRNRVNADELDDVDDWNAAEDGEDEDVVPRERELLRAKRERQRRKRGGGMLGDTYGDPGAAAADDDADNDEDAIRGNMDGTHIDQTTSLAAEDANAGEGGGDGNASASAAIEPFSMNQETTDGTGYFDGDTYVFRRQGKEDDEPDAWLDSLKETTATATTQNTKRQTMDDDDDDDDEEDDHNDSGEKAGPEMLQLQPNDLYAKILPHLLQNTNNNNKNKAKGGKGETVTQALVRYGRLLKQLKAQEKRNQKTNTTTGAAATIGTASSCLETQILQAQTSLDDLTSAANALLLRQVDVDIYGKTYQELVQKVVPPKCPTPTHHDKKSVVAAVQWEYMGNEDKQLHGPYTALQMQGWIQAGYFVGPSAVRVRTVQQQQGPAVAAAPAAATTTTKTIQEDLLSDLMDDDDDDGDGDNGNSNGTTKEEPGKVTEPVRGDWMMSDQVDFAQYA